MQRVVRENNPKKIGKRFKELRESLDTFEKDCTLKMLADELHVTVSLISKLEKGKKIPSLDSVLLYANYFNVSTDYILCRSEHPKTNCKDLNIFSKKTLEALYSLKFNYDKSGDCLDVNLLNILLGSEYGDIFWNKLRSYLFSNPDNFNYFVEGKPAYSKEINVISKNGVNFNMFSNEVSSILRNDLLKIIDTIKEKISSEDWNIQICNDEISYFENRPYKE